MSEQKKFRYYAFISYSHIDKKWADWLHRTLESWRVPRRLAGLQVRGGTVPDRIYPVFRDREELPTSSDLGSMINEALESSRYLIVICSRNSARSRWVNEEILAFKRLGRSNCILSIIVDGEPNATDKGLQQADECFPEALKYEVADDGNLSSVRTEPIAADARPGKDGKEDAKLKLLAGMIGVGFDELKQRELQKKQRRLAIITSASLSVATITVFLAITAYIARNEAVLQRTEAERQQKIAETARDEAQKNLAASLFEKSQKAYERKQYNEAAILAAEAWVRNSSNYYPGIIAHEDMLTPLVAIVSNKNINGVNDVVVNNNHMYSCDNTGKIRKWDIEKNRLLNEINAHDALIRDLALNNDGSRLLSASYDGTVKIWDTMTDSLVREYKGHKGLVYSVSITKKGDLVASGDNSGRIHVWRYQNGEMVTELKSADQVAVMQLRFTPDGNALVSSGDNNGELSIWNTRDWTVNRILSPVRYGIWGLDISPDGSFIAYAAGNSQENLTLVNMSGENADMETVRFPEAWFHDVLISQNQSFMVASTRYGSINLLDLDSRQWISSVFAHDLASRHVALIAGDRQVVSSSIDGTIRIWDISANLSEKIHEFEGGNVRIFSIALNHSASLVAAGDADGAVRIWSAVDGQLLMNWRDPDKKIITHVEFFPDDRALLLAGSGKHTILLLDDMERINYQYRNSSEEPHLKILSDGNRIIRTANKGRVEVFDQNTESIIFQFDNKRTFPHALAVDSAEEILAVGGYEGEIDLWGLNTGELLGSIPAHRHSIRAMIFDSKGSLYTAGTDARIRHWNVSSRTLLREIGGHNSRIRTLALSPDQSQLASGDEDGKVKIWDVRTGEEILAYHGPASYVSDVRFGKNGDILFIAYFDGSLRKVDLGRTRTNPRDHLNAVRKITGLEVTGIHTVTLEKSAWEKLPASGL